jgi:ketosteroid isomerase-like protein
VIEVRRGRGSESGVEVEQRAAAVWTLQEGLVTKIDSDFDPQETLEAMGVEG